MSTAHAIGAVALCSIDGCEAKVIARGWCTKHYQRWLRLGSAEAVVQIRGNDEARFFSYVDQRPNGCWLWTGGRNGPYGKFNVAGRTVGAHVFSYELEHGPVPVDLQLDHFRCDTPLCVHPDHVRPTTARENSLRSSSPPALNLAKTRCPKDHPYDEANTRWYRGGRHCRACSREHNRQQRAKAKAA